MTGRTGGGVTLLQNEYSTPVLRVWCVPHQLDLVVKRATNGVDNGDFCKDALAFLVYLRMQQNFINQIGWQCPKDTTRWIAFGAMLKWKTQNRRCIQEHVLERRPLQAPTDEWWIIASCLHPLFETLKTSSMILQARELVILQQRDEMAAMVAIICVGIDARMTSDRSFWEVDQKQWC